MGDLVPGGNQAMPVGVLVIRVRGPFDVSVLITGHGGKVAGDEDFVFFNQPVAPGARLDGDTVMVDPRRLRAGASRVTVVVSPAEPGTPMGRLPVPVMSVMGSDGMLVARFIPPRPTQETVLLLAEIYRRGTEWKLRALGQGYADGLAGVARDFGVDVADDGSSGGADGGFVGLVNAERSRSGVPALALDARLVAAARAHAGVMAAQGQLGAEGPDGTSLFHRVAASGYAYLTIAEHRNSRPALRSTRAPSRNTVTEPSARPGVLRCTACSTQVQRPVGHSHSPRPSEVPCSTEVGRYAYTSAVPPLRHM
ncbi:hypothetical protein FCI23_30220 [Actinacidiphila oryziradicis]|uniref:TerD domain-containing protein n=1 Tax=Actinacidiphila oryziradicis TaxID=2571141 RepID=A0A4U0SBC9_9ACTN|nr:hypothetical protein FCI23_30220 [Actinacidiphila oryziradicis]